jgi:type IV pilus assembly protein PilO
MAWYNPTDPKQRNALIIGVLLLALIYPFYSFWYKGKREEVTAMQTRLETLEDQNRRAQVMAARGGGDLEERLALYERQVSKLEELIPAAEEVAGLLDDISARARQAGVEVARMIPEPPEPGAFYSKTSYEMGVIGEYHDVARFLTEVASLSRIVTPVELDLHLFDQPDRYPELQSPVVGAFRIETYVLPEPGAAPAPAAAPAGG